MESKSLAKVGAIILVVGAVLLAITGSPPNVMPLKAAEDIGVLAYAGEDKVNPLVLAEWIIGETGDYYIIDIRDPAGFYDFNIDGSVSLPFTSLMTQAGIDQLPKYKKIVIVYGDGTRAGQAWTVLRGKGFDAYILEGGIKGWWEKVMTPVSVQQVEPEMNQEDLSAKIRTMREHFSGVESQLNTPSQDIKVPPPPTPVQAPSKDKKKIGGC
jgi:rhodanese-related sulfurtransferase